MASLEALLSTFDISSFYEKSKKKKKITQVFLRLIRVIYFSQSCQLYDDWYQSHVVLLSFFKRDNEKFFTPTKIFIKQIDLRTYKVE